MATHLPDPQDPASFDAPAKAYSQVIRTGDTHQPDPFKTGRGMAPNMGNDALPHVVTFQGLFRTMSQVYRISDEALRDSYANARHMRHTLAIEECLEQRQRSVCLLDWHVKPEDESSPIAKQLATEVDAIVRAMWPSFLKYREWLMLAIWYGRNACQHRYRWKQINGKERCVVDRWLPVHGDKLVFKYEDPWDAGANSDQVGIRVGAGYHGGKVANRWHVERVGKVGATDYGLAYFLEPWERPLLCIHTHQIEDAPFESPEYAGWIHGVGIRNRIYWEWMQCQETLAFLFEYLERSAFGLELWYYPAGNPEAEAKTKAAAEQYVGNRRTAVLVPFHADAGMAGSPGVQRIEPSMAGAEVLHRLLTEFFGHRIKRLILGQTLTTESGSTGLGSNLASVHLDTYLQIVRYDATNLGETLTHELVKPIVAYNFAQYADVPLKFVIETEAPDVESKLQAIQTAWGMGLRVKAADVYDMISLAPPEATDEVLQNKQGGGGGMPGMGGDDGGNGRPPQSPGFGPGGKQADDDGERDEARNVRALKDETADNEGKTQSTAEGYARTGERHHGNRQQDTQVIVSPHSRSLARKLYPGTMALADSQRERLPLIGGNPDTHVPIVRENEAKLAAVAEEYRRNAEREPYRAVSDKPKPANEKKDDDSGEGEHKDGWRVVGGGAKVFIRDSKIVAGCPGLKGEDVEDIQNESDESRDRRDHRQDVAEEAGIKGEHLDAAGVKSLEKHPHPDDGKDADGKQVAPPKQPSLLPPDDPKRPGLPPKPQPPQTSMDHPATVAFNGKPMEVYKRGSQWFFRRDKGAGWTVASQGTADAIEAQLAQHVPEASDKHVTAAEVLAMVKQSPNLAARDQQQGIDWDKYADRFGIEGNFHKDTVPLSTLQSLSASGWLRMSKQSDQGTVNEKALSGQLNPVVITKEPGRGLLVVDGTHSLIAAAVRGDKDVQVIVSDEAAKHFEGKRDSGQQYEYDYENGQFGQKPERAKDKPKPEPVAMTAAAKPTGEEWDNMETGYHVTANADRIRQEGFRAGRGVGIGGDTGRVFTSQDPQYLGRLAEHMNKLQDVLRADNPIAAAKEYVHASPEMVEQSFNPMIGLYERRMGRQLTDQEKAGVIAASGPLMRYPEIKPKFGDDLQKFVGNQNRHEVLKVRARSPIARSDIFGGERAYKEGDVFLDEGEQPAAPAPLAAAVSEQAPQPRPTTPQKKFNPASYETQQAVQQLLANSLDTLRSTAKKQGISDPDKAAEKFMPFGMSKTTATTGKYQKALAKAIATAIVEHRETPAQQSPQIAPDAISQEQATPAPEQTAEASPLAEAVSEQAPEVNQDPAAWSEPGTNRKAWQMTRKELRKQFDEHLKVPNNSMTPWEGELPPIGTWRVDPDSGGMEQLRYMPIDQLRFTESENDVKNRDDYKQYVEWAKEGKQPPPIGVLKHVDGSWVSTNRRRLMAAKAAGQKQILAWVSDTDQRTGRAFPQHKDLVAKAVERGEQVPPEVLKDYPDLAKQQAPQTATAATAPEQTVPSPAADAPPSPATKPRLSTKARKLITARAEEENIDPDVLAEAVDDTITEKQQWVREREAAKAAIRKTLGLTAGMLAAVENSGKDYATAARKIGGETGKRLAALDSKATALAGEYPELMLGDPDKGDDIVAALWQVIREGVQRVPQATDETILRDAVERAKTVTRWHQGEGVGDSFEDDWGDTADVGDREAVPFARERIDVQAYRRWILATKYQPVERYAKFKPAAGQQSLFGEHDVTNEPRDAGGKWTTGGNVHEPASEPEAASPESKPKTIAEHVQSKPILAVTTTFDETGEGGQHNAFVRSNRMWADDTDEHVQKRIVAAKDLQESMKPVLDAASGADKFAGKQYVLTMVQPQVNSQSLMKMIDKETGRFERATTQQKKIWHATAVDELAKAVQWDAEAELLARKTHGKAG